MAVTEPPFHPPPEFRLVVGARTSKRYKDGSNEVFAQVLKLPGAVGPVGWHPGQFTLDTRASVERAGWRQPSLAWPLGKQMVNAPPRTQSLNFSLCTLDRLPGSRIRRSKLRVTCVRYLSRMGLLDHLGGQRRKHYGPANEVGRFMPLQLIDGLESVRQVTRALRPRCPSLISSPISWSCTSWTSRLTTWSTVDS